MELQALAVRTGNILVSQLADSEQGDDNLLSCDVAGWLIRSRYVALLMGTAVLRATQKSEHSCRFQPGKTPTVPKE